MMNHNIIAFVINDFQCVIHFCNSFCHLIQGVGHHEITHHPIATCLMFYDEIVLHFILEVIDY